jgi:hypothetical protein
MRRREWCECEVPGETTTRGLGLKRKEERVRKKRDKKTAREKKICSRRLLQARQCKPRSGMQRIVPAWGVGRNVGVS